MNILVIWMRALREKVQKVDRTTKPQNFSYSKVVPVVDTAALDAAHSGWESSAASNGYKFGKKTDLTDSVSPLWKDESGNWTDVNPGTNPPEGFKILVTGPIS